MSSSRCARSSCLLDAWVIVKPGEDVVCLPAHTASDPCSGMAYTVEFQRVAQACPGDVMGLVIVGMDMDTLPCPYDVTMLCL